MDVLWCSISDIYSKFYFIFYKWGNLERYNVNESMGCAKEMAWIIHSFFMLHNSNAIKSIFMCSQRIIITYTWQMKFEHSNPNPITWKPSNNCNWNELKRNSNKIQLDWIGDLSVSAAELSQTILYASVAWTWHKFRVAHLAHLIENISDLH